MQEYIINVDSPVGKKLGFTSDKFDKLSYLWYTPGEITISTIATAGDKNHTGYFKNLITNLLKYNLNIFIPTPSVRMREIGKKQGWKLYDNDGCIGFGIIGRK